MTRKFMRIAIAIGVLVPVWSGTAVASPAASSSTETSHVVLVIPRTAASPAVTVSCTAQNNNPHYSTGAKGVIAKVVVQCNYTLYVNVYGTIAAGPKIGPGVVVADSNQTQLVTVGIPKTYYVPQATEIAPPCVKTDYYQLSSNIQIVSPPGTVASGASQKVLAGCP